jgi:hypothetical protein
MLLLKIGEVKPFIEPFIEPFIQPFIEPFIEPLHRAHRACSSSRLVADDNARPRIPFGRKSPPKNVFVKTLASDAVA